MLKIGVLASGRGSNFQAIIDGINNKEIDGRIVVLITDNPSAMAIERAKNNNIPVSIVERKNFSIREEMDIEIKRILDKNNVDLIVLAGYMRILRAKELLDSYRWKIINIHPALLPSFRGEQAQKQAFEHGVKVSGVTIHFVDETLDGGPIIYQEPVYIGDCESAEEVSERILKREHKALKKVVSSFAKGRYIVEGKKVKFVPNGA